MRYVPYEKETRRHRVSSKSGILGTSTPETIDRQNDLLYASEWASLGLNAVGGARLRNEGSGHLSEGCGVRTVEDIYCVDAHFDVFWF